MIRSMLNSLNGGGGSHTSAAADHHNHHQQHSSTVAPGGASKKRIDDADEVASTKSNDSSEIAEPMNGERRVKCSISSSKLNAVKRGRKKLSSMMSRLTRATGGGGGRASDSESDGADENHHGDDVNDYGDDDNDDDDDAYKSAEEACRKMSLGGEQQAATAAVAAPRRTSILKLRGRKSSSAAMRNSAMGTTNCTNDSANYEQLKEDKKYILPEEQCDIPTFLQTKNCPPHLIEETRKLLKERYAKNPDNFYDADYQRMLTDDWTVSRFLLRRRLDPKRTAKLMEECGRFRKQYKMSEVMLWEFPNEFHQAGGLFKYAPDRVGNITMYMRVKMYRRVPEISDVFKAFILCVLEQCDVANGGRGTAVIFDLSQCGLQNVDLGFLSWLLSSFRNYCPKGVSYILVYNLPWILNATCKLAMTWMSASNKRALRFVYGDEIENFIERSNLPDYLGGECKINYRAIPEGSRPAIEVCDRLDMTREQAIKIRELFKEYLIDDNENNNNNNNNETTAVVADDENNNNNKHHHGSSQTTNTQKTIKQDHIKTSSSSSSPSNTTTTGLETVDLVSQASKFIAS